MSNIINSNVMQDTTSGVSFKEFIREFQIEDNDTKTCVVYPTCNEEVYLKLCISGNYEVIESEGVDFSEIQLEVLFDAVHARVRKESYTVEGYEKPYEEYDNEFNYTPRY